MMKDKSGEFALRLVLHKGDERQIRRVTNEISPS
jgi:16S rRNA U516 pseudouridylate synthase RsuA-like enzyme